MKLQYADSDYGLLHIVIISFKVLIAFFCVETPGQNLKSSNFTGGQIALF